MLLFFRIRRFCHFVVNLRYFDLFIMIVICASSFALATEEPVNEDAFRNKILNYFDYVFTIVFTVEMILKVCQTQVYRISGYFFVDICFAFYKITFNFPKIQRNRKCIWYCLKKTFYCLKWHILLSKMTHDINEKVTWLFHFCKFFDTQKNLVLCIGVYISFLFTHIILMSFSPHDLYKLFTNYTWF